MDVLIVEPLDPDVLQWLGLRHGVRYAPQLAHDSHALKKGLLDVRSMIIPPQVAVDASVLQLAPRLLAVGRLSSGAENIDLDACARAGVEVVRPANASAQSEAEFVIGALLQTLRRVPVFSSEGLLVGRELGSLQVGIVGMAPAARPLARLLAAFGAQVVGYDPALHASDNLWAACGVAPMALSDLMEGCDGICVLLNYASRYRGLLGERFLAAGKANQVLVCLAHSSVFDEHALAAALRGGRIAAAWFDSMEPGSLDAGRPLRHLDNLQVTPRLASTTRESRSRSAWEVAHRIDDLLEGRVPRPGVRWSSPRDDLAALEDGPAPG